MKLTDVIAIFLKKNGVKTVFGLQGGAVVHIFDSLEKKKVKVIYNHHEESAALAAASFAKVEENIGCAVVTTGPGSTNAITGLLGAWQDSIPVIFISGQVRTDHMSYGKKVRQVGTQEVNIIDVVKPLTKFAKLVRNKEDILRILKEALTVSISGRPGPVWIDLPLNYQWEDVRIDKNDIKKIFVKKQPTPKKDKIKSLQKLLGQASAPLFLIGYGLRLSKQHVNFYKFLKKHNYYYVTTWTASDLYGTDDKHNLGIIGMRGQKGANKAMFKSDLIVCVGSHLSIPHTTTLTNNYAPNAKKVAINIDLNQIKNMNIKPDLHIHSDLSQFLPMIKNLKLKKYSGTHFKCIKNLNWFFPKQIKKPNPNTFIRHLSQSITNKVCYVVDGGGTALYAGFQSLSLKRSQRVICSSAISSMGTGLAESIGAHASKKFSQIICIIGDGSFLMNIQDLQNISSDRMHIKIIVVNNNGYLAIRHTQNEFLSGKLYGTHPDWSLKMPSIKKLAYGFGIEYISLSDKRNINKVCKKVKNFKGPLICEVNVDEDVTELFRQAYKDNEDGTFSPLPLSNMQSSV